MRVLWSSASVLVLVLLVACSDSGTWLEDRADLLSEDQAQALNTYHEHLLADHGIDYRVVIEAGEADVNRRAVKLFESIGVGQRSEGGRGLLLLLDPEQDQVRVEVSQALEGVYPDALISYLERRQMVPFFQRGRVADGIVATTELIVTRAQEAAENKAFDPSTLPAATGGAGATTEAELGAGGERQRSSGGPDVAAGEGPERRSGPIWRRWTSGMIARGYPSIPKKPRRCCKTGR
ncbi:TPM domain-containing protein [Halomonadaceae bacterium KBTZ08]